MHRYWNDMDGQPFKMEVVTGRQLGQMPHGWSRIEGCLIRTRDGDPMPLFGAYAGEQPGRMRVDLVGYAVVPLECWNGVVDLARIGAQLEGRAALDRAMRARRAAAPPPMRWLDRIAAAWLAYRGKPPIS